MTESRRRKRAPRAEEALRLSPTLGEAHMALGLCLYLGEKKYDVALKELRLRWEWDSLRSNPRFQKILAGPEPKTIFSANR